MEEHNARVNSPAEFAGQPAVTIPDTYLDSTVQVYYAAAGFADTGRMVRVSDHWIEMEKDNGERLLIPVNAVRLVKILEPSRTGDDLRTLMRAARLEAE